MTNPKTAKEVRLAIKRGNSPTVSAPAFEEFELAELAEAANLTNGSLTITDIDGLDDYDLAQIRKSGGQHVTLVQSK